MTVAVLTHPPKETVPRRLGLAPAIHRPGEPPTVVATVTVQVLLGDDVQDPAAALRTWLDHLAETCEVTVPRLRLVTTTVPTLDVQRPSGAQGLGGVLVDDAAHSVSSDGTRVDLCRREYELLLFLAEHPRQVFTRGQLLAAVWADSFTGPRTVDVHVNRLRNKLSRRDDLITTVRGVGYRLADDARVAVQRGAPVRS